MANLVPWCAGELGNWWERMQPKAIPYVLLLGLLWGSSLVASRFSVGQYDPRTYITLRLILASIAHLSIYVFSGWLWAKRPFPRDPRLWRRAAVLGVLGTAISMTAIISSMQYQSSGLTALLLTLNPVVTVMFAQFFLPDERLTWQTAAGIAIALAGVGLLLLRGENGLSELGQADWRGYAWAFFGIVGSAAGSVYARRYLRHSDSWDVASIRMFTATIVLIPLTYFTVGYDLSGVDATGYAALGYAALIGTFAGMWLSFYIVKRFGATSASQTSYVLPVVSILLGALLLNEQITTTMLTGMVVIFVGLALLNWQGDFRPIRRRRRLGLDPGD